MCVECGGAVDVAARFCGGCGAARDVPEEAADGIERYRSVFARFVTDGALGPKEIAQLEVLRGKLGITRGTHARLLEELDPNAAPVGVRLWVDVSTFVHFQVGQRGLVRARVGNDADLALEAVALAASVSGQAAEPARTYTIFPGEDSEVSLWFTPQTGGFAELEGELTTHDLMGATRRYRFSGLQFRIGGDGPQVQILNIDQSSARVVDNSRSQFAGAPAGGVVDGRDWRQMPVREILGAAPPSGTSEPEAVDFRVTTDAGGYHVTAVIGYGDISTVYGGDMDAADGGRRKVAVKIADDDADNDLVQREVRTLRLLTRERSRQRKHLPRLLDQFKTPDGRAANVFAHVDGYDLVRVREKYPDGIPDVHLLWVFRRCLSAVGWAHSQGVLHGNLEPAHILLRPRDHNIWLVDWCWSVVNPAQTGDGFKALNEPYSAPEVAARKAPVPASDLYALGQCMIFAAGGDPATGDIPDRVDERIVRLLRFFTRPSARQRAQDAWQMYTRLEALRDEMFGGHKFRKFEI
jgi:hypothetical protein